MDSAVAPLVHVDAGHPLDGRQRSLDPDYKHTHLGAELVGQLVEIEMRPGMEHDRRQRQRLF